MDAGNGVDDDDEAYNAPPDSLAGEEGVAALSQRTLRPTLGLSGLELRLSPLTPTAPFVCPMLWT